MRLDVEEKVLEALERAAGRVLQRADLTAITGYSDRQVRAAVASLIDTHSFRIETAPNGGYFIPAPDNAYSAGRRFIKQGFALVGWGRKLPRLSERAERFKLQMPLFGRRGK